MRSVVVTKKSFVARCAHNGTDTSQDDTEEDCAHQSVTNARTQDRKEGEHLKRRKEEKQQ